jgi:hypothetical protein
MHARVIKAARQLENVEMDWSNTELAVHLGWSINRITPRVKELRDMDIVIKSQRRKCRVNKDSTVIAWRLK